MLQFFTLETDEGVTPRCCLVAQQYEDNLSIQIGIFECLGYFDELHWLMEATIDLDAELPDGAIAVNEEAHPGLLRFFQSLGLITKVLYYVSAIPVCEINRDVLDKYNEQMSDSDWEFYDVIEKVAFGPVADYCYWRQYAMTETNERERATATWSMTQASEQINKLCSNYNINRSRLFSYYRVLSRLNRQYEEEQKGREFSVTLHLAAIKNYLREETPEEAV